MTVSWKKEAVFRSISPNECNSCFLTVEATVENFHRAAVVRGSWNRRDRGLSESDWRYWMRFNPQLAQRFIEISLVVQPEYLFLIFCILSWNIDTKYTMTNNDSANYFAQTTRINSIINNWQKKRILHQSNTRQLN